MQFGPSLDKRKMLGLVTGTLWNEFIELNRMAFADWLPRNSESRAIGYAMRWIKKTYPQIKWVVSFADATQCGDGTIYRASGFLLTQIKKNNQLWEAPGTNEKFSRVSLTDARSAKQKAKAGKLCHRDSVTKGTGTHSCGGGSSMRKYIEAGFRPLDGFQLRYIYFIDPSARDRLTVPILPFKEIERQGASMYRGTPRAKSERVDTAANHAAEGGSSPTLALTEIVNGG